MKTLVLYQYRVYDPIRRQWYTTHHMTEEDAAQRTDQPQRLDGTREERIIKDDPFANSLAFLSRGPK